METITIPQSEYVELLRYRELIQMFEDVLHAPEFKKEFVERVLAAEKRVNTGEKVRFSSINEMSKYLDKMEE